LRTFSLIGPTFALGARLIGGLADRKKEMPAPQPVPLHLRNGVTGLMRGLGYGEGYAYSHDYAADAPRRWAQRYLPDGVADQTFYQPGAQGFEAETIARRLKRIAEMRDT